MTGFVYVLGNQSMPGLLKVGMTLRSPYARLQELSAHTSVPEKFHLLAFFMCDDARAAEARAHDYLSDHRVRENREFFRCHLASVCGGLEGYPAHITEEGAHRFADEMVQWIADGQIPTWDQLVCAGLICAFNRTYVDGFFQHKAGVRLGDYLQRMFVSPEAA